MADVDDRWFRTDRITGEKVKTARHGKGLQYAARWRDEAGQQRSKSFRIKRDADLFLAQALVDLAKGDYIDHRAGRITLRDYVLNEWLPSRSGMAASTRERVELRLRLHVLPALGAKELRLLKAPVIKPWVRGLEDALAPSYVRSIVTTLSMILNSAVEDDKIKRNPFEAKSQKSRGSAIPVQKPTERKVEPWPAAWVAGARVAMREQWAETVTAGAGLGLRQGEIFGLAVEDIDWPRASRVVVRQQVKIVGGRMVFDRPKGGKEREVPLSETVSLRLASHLEAYPAVRVTLPWESAEGKPRSFRLIFSRNGTALNRNHFNDHIWKPALRRAGVPPTRENGCHALRHYFASAVLHGGASIRELADWLGHGSPAFTMSVYCHLMPEGQDRARAAVDVALAGLPADIARAGV